MAFGQQSGPPASFRQTQKLLALLRDAGHADFRDARGPMGFTQRQAAGKFTRDEAEAFIEQLENAAEGTTAAPQPAAPEPEPTATRPAMPNPAAHQTLTDVPTEQLAAELQRRGWIVMEP